MNQLSDKPHVQHNKFTWLGRTVNPSFSKNQKSFLSKEHKKVKSPKAVKPVLNLTPLTSLIHFIVFKKSKTPTLHVSLPGENILGLISASFVKLLPRPCLKTLNFQSLFPGVNKCRTGIA